MIMYADDTILFVNSEAELQLLLNKLANYGDKYGIQVNVNKTTNVFVKIENRPMYLSSSMSSG